MESQGLLSYVKKVIHSLVVSTPDRMTVERLRRDYANEEGTAVPFIKLGFKDIDSFLRSIPDTIMVFGYGPMAEVLAQMHAKTAHIQNLVQSQKRPSNKNRNRRGHKPRFSYPSERSDLVFVNENHRFNNNNNNYSPMHNGQQRSRQAQGVHRRNDEVSITNSLNKLKIAPVDDESSVDSFEIYVPDQPIGTNRAQDRSTKAKKDDVPISNELKEPATDQPVIYISSDEGCDEDSIPEYDVSDHVVNNNSTKNVLINVDTKIKAAEKLPQYRQPAIEYISSEEGSDAEAIPAYAVDERVLNTEYPKNVVQFDQHLPIGDINQKVKLHDCIEVQLVMVSSPHKFFFWIHDDQYEEYKAMSTNMQRFYQNIDNKRYTIPLFLIMPGHLGVIYSDDNMWQRVKVLDIKAGNRNNIEVELIDTGERTWICHSNLKYMCKDFATLPPQCWRGRLACVTPRQGTQFSANASNYFYELVSYRRLFAKIEKIGDRDNVLYMVLVDTDAESTLKNVNIALIESGWVRRSYNP